MPTSPNSWKLWLPPAAVATVFVAAVFGLSSLTQPVRVALFRTWNSLGDPGRPPERVLVLTLPKAQRPGPDARVRELLKPILQAGAAAVAVDGALLGLQDRTSTQPLSASEWLPPNGGQVPVVVGYPWSHQAPGVEQGAAEYSLPPHYVLQHALDLPKEKGLAQPLFIDDAKQVSLGFLENPGPPSVEASLFRRNAEGLTPSLAVEVLRRAMRLPLDQSLPHVDGIGELMGKSMLLPVNAKGGAPVSRYRPSAWKTFPAMSLLDGNMNLEELRGKVVFLVEPATPPLWLGNWSAGETAALQASNLLGRQSPVAPAAGETMAKGAGLLFAVLAGMAFIWFGKSMGLTIAVGLALIYPALSQVFFLASRWWLPPEFPLLAVTGASLPFLFWPAPRHRPYASRSAPVKAKAEKQKQNQRPLADLESEEVHPVDRGAVVTPVPAQVAKETLVSNAASQAIRMPSPIAEPAHLSAPAPQPTPAPAPEAKPANAGPKLGPMPSLKPPSGEIERDGMHNLLRIGKYKVLRKMGHGSAGEVYEAIDLQMGRRVALKTMMPTAQLHFDRAFERFLVEARAAGSLNHPNINTIHDFGTVDHISFMVLEYLDGMTLSQWMKSHAQPSYAGIAPWIEQIASALDYAHAHKVIHRDLKPSNLMVVTEGNAIKLLDFGVAKFGDVMLTQTGMTVGTPTYMSPEQLQGLKVGPGSDQYTLGVLVFQMLSYRLPYVGQKIPEICNRILKGELTPITEYRPEFPPALWDVFLRAFSRNPENRFPSCLAFYHAMDTAMATAKSPDSPAHA